MILQLVYTNCKKKSAFLLFVYWSKFKQIKKVSSSLKVKNTKHLIFSWYLQMNILHLVLPNIVHAKMCGNINILSEQYILYEICCSRDTKIA